MSTIFTQLGDVIGTRIKSVEDQLNGTTGGVTLSDATFNNYLKEEITISTTALTGTVNVDVKTQTVTYFTSNATANWSVNVRGDASTTLASVLDVGQSLTVVLLTTQGGTAYYPTAFAIDGTSVTVKWQGGSKPTSGNASSVDSYTYTIIKTSTGYSVFGSQAEYA